MPFSMRAYNCLFPRPFSYLSGVGRYKMLVAACLKADMGSRFTNIEGFKMGQSARVRSDKSRSLPRGHARAVHCRINTG